MLVQRELPKVDRLGRLDRLEVARDDRHDGSGQQVDVLHEPPKITLADPSEEACHHIKREVPVQMDRIAALGQTSRQVSNQLAFSWGKMRCLD